MGNIQAESEANQQKNALLEKQQSQMERLANFDALTGLPNRQFLMKILSSELTKARTNRSELGLLFVDIDGHYIRYIYFVYIIIPVSNENST
mgnify:CR=1 FL=1